MQGGGGRSSCHCVIVVVIDIDGVVVVIVVGGHVDDAGDVGGPTRHRHQCWGWSSCASALVAPLTPLMVGVIVSGGHIDGVGGRGSSSSMEVVVALTMLVVGHCRCRCH